MVKHLVLTRKVLFCVFMIMGMGYYLLTEATYQSERSYITLFWMVVLFSYFASGTRKQKLLSIFEKSVQYTTLFLMGAFLSIT